MYSITYNVLNNVPNEEHNRGGGEVWIQDTIDNLLMVKENDSKIPNISLLFHEFCLDYFWWTF